MIKARRLWITRVMSMAAFVLLVTRLGYLQLYCHAALTERALREHSRQGTEEQTRGAILDRSGEVLAMSIQGGACFADPALISNAEETARALAPVLQLSPSVLKAKLMERRRFVWLARRLDPETAQAVQDLHRPGIYVNPEMKRFYPEEALAAQVLGVVGDDGQGLSGVERVADSWLSGRSAPFLFKQWEVAKKLPTSALDKSETPAHSVVITIDRTLQTIVEQELAEQMKISRPKSGTVVIEDPETGDILAMASAPSFNPNFWGQDGHSQDYSPDTLNNPAVEKVVEPGSTFKLVTAAAALDEHIVSPTDSFNCENGLWQIEGRTIHDHEKDGWLTFTDVISHSSNIGTAKVALRLGSDGLYRYARAFGFGMPTGCGLPGDGNGILRTPREWHVGSLPTIAFGQEVGVTALQMVNAYTVVANGGWLMEPRLFKGITDEDGVYHEWARRRPIRRVVSPGTVVLLRQILKEVVDHGTGKEAQVVGLDVAGKTGTAQKIDPTTHQYSANRYLASFCGFAPVDHPRLVIGVFLDEPANTYWGGSEAAPLFSHIVRDAASYLHLENSSIGPLAVSRTISQS